MNKRNSLIVVILLLIIIGLMFGILVGIRGMTNSGDDSNKGGVGLVVDPNAGEYVAPEKEEAPKQGVAIPGWSSITLPANTEEITVDFMNPEENKDLYYLTFELRLLDDSKEEGYEVLYKSGLVEPGLHIQKIKLSKGLAVGEYDAVMHVQPYRMNEEKTPTNNANMNTKLIVK